MPSSRRGEFRYQLEIHGNSPCLLRGEESSDINWKFAETLRAFFEARRVQISTGNSRKLSVPSSRRGEFRYQLEIHGNSPCLLRGEESSDINWKFTDTASRLGSRLEEADAGGWGSCETGVVGSDRLHEESFDTGSLPVVRKLSPRDGRAIKTVKKLNLIRE